MNFVINGINWNLVYVSPVSSKLTRSDGSITVGMTDITEKRVYISDNLQGQFLKKVISHEIVHCSMFSYGVDLGIEQEELVADLIATYGEEIIDTANRLFERLRMVA